MTENALHDRFRVTPSPVGPDLYGVFDTTLQEWAARQKDGTEVGMDLDLETAFEAADQLNAEQNEPGIPPVLETNDDELY